VHDERRPADVVVLGLPHFRVLAAVEVDGQLEVTVENIATRTGCPECAVVAGLRDRRETVVRYVDVHDRPARLRLPKRVALSRAGLSSARTWPERSEAVRPHRSLAERMGFSRRTRSTRSHTFR
jgi:hypothetical protein